MRASTFYASLLALAPMASAVHPPSADGMKLAWYDNFDGNAGSPVNEDEWDYRLYLTVNNELQTYTKSNQNVQLSGGQTLQIVPRKEKDGSWTSGRLETKESFTAQPGKKMLWQAGIRMGQGMHRQGMWPAFWLLGDSMREGTEWPQCGELDIFEQVNGAMTAYGTLHCGEEAGGVCNEPNGIRGSVAIPDNEFHQWSLVIDRTSGDWKTESITWLMDGTPFKQVTGSQIGDEPIWSTLAHSPLFMIVNVAVGGDWPGNPSAETEDGYDNMMEVLYAAVYESQ